MTSRDKIPLHVAKIQAGFPAFCEDYIEDHLDLNQFLIKNPAATFFVKVTGESMIEAGIFEDDILIVDRSLTATNGKIVIAEVDGLLTVKRLVIKQDKVYLKAENKIFPPLIFPKDYLLQIWGVVTFVIHKV